MCLCPVAQKRVDQTETQGKRVTEHWRANVRRTVSMLQACVYCKLYDTDRQIDPSRAGEKMHRTPWYFSWGQSKPKALLAFLAFKKFFFLLGGTRKEISGSFGLLNTKIFSPVFNMSMVSTPVIGMCASSPMGSRDRCGQLPFPGNVTLSWTGVYTFFNMLQREETVRSCILNPF